MDAIDAPDVDEFNPTLFRKKNGVPIPFVIDGPPNITHENRVALSEWITGSGGSVVDALPTSDPCFFVFDADVSKDNAIKLCTKTTQHPVHFSWIITSIEENKRAKWWLPMPDEPKPLRMAILTHINTTKRILEDFVTEHKGYQLPVYIDYSIQGEDRQQLAKLVNKHGGFPTLFEDQARIILADQSNEDWYEHIWGEDGVFSRIRSSDCWIESPSALRRWIRDRNVNLTPVRKPTASPRRKPSALRTEFTMSDDRLLVIYLAKTAPFGGGRQGNNIYHQLEENLQRDAAKAEKKSEETRTTEDKNVIYAAQHTWQSWQNRYKKSKEDFDQRIERHLETHPYLSQRGGETARPVKRPKRSTTQGNAKVTVEIDMEEVDQLDGENDDEAAEETQNQADEADEVAAEAAVMHVSDDESNQAQDDSTTQAKASASHATAPAPSLPPAYATQVPAGHTRSTPPASPVKPKRGRGRPKKAHNDPIAELLTQYGDFVTEAGIRRMLDANAGDVEQAKTTLKQLYDLPQNRQDSPNTAQSEEQEGSGEEQQEQEDSSKRNLVEPRATRSQAAKRAAADLETGPITRRTRQKSAISRASGGS